MLNGAWRPQFIFLDFDGVIMDSMSLKLESYAYALAPFGLKADVIRPLQLLSAGISRRKTLPFMVRELLGQEMSGPEIEAALARFRESDEANRSRMRFMPGAVEFFEAAGHADIPLFILTGTPQDVIEVTVDIFHIRKYFEGILGSPPGKVLHLQEQARAQGIELQAGLFVGDSPKDQEAARIAGIPFVGLAASEEEANAFGRDHLQFQIQSLEDLLPLLADK